MSAFARLEIVDNKQILAELFHDDAEFRYIRIRREDDDFYVYQKRFGPWPATDFGWEQAEQAFEELDLVKVARELDQATKNHRESLFPGLQSSS